MARRTEMTREHAALLLGVDECASADDVQRAWKVWVRLAHPDAGGDRDHFEALMHAMTTVSTGGFSTHDASLGHYNATPSIQWVAVVFMLSGSLPFIWYLRGWTRRSLASEQVRVYLLSLGVIVLAVSS